MKASVDELPFQLAIRLILDDVANSNALPDWLHPVYVDYSAREVLLRKQAHLYLAGDYAKRASFSILVPKKSGEKKLWFLPSVNDQMLLQACVSSFAVQLDNQLEDQSVYSYRLNRELDRVALVADQVSAWAAFQAETHKRCADQDCLLQFDLRDAFGSIDRSRVYQWVGSYASEGCLTLMKVLIEKASPEKGLPLINDTVFFLGNAYLSEVDNIVRRYSGNFIRFVDDYRIFGSSKDSLELVYNNISKDLEQLGFRVNPLKTKLGTTSEYLDLISIVREGDGGYVSPMVLRGIPSDEQIIGTIGSIVEKPDLYLNEGFGRFQLGVIRRHRYNEEISSFALAAGIEELSDLLLENSSIVKKLASLLDGYSSAPDEIWRTVWLLYVGDGLKKRSKEFSQVVKRLSANPDTVPIAKLWARVRNDAPVPNLDQLHELDYLQSGALYFGERTE